MKTPITVAIAGLGNRGNDIYAHYEHVAPDEMKVVAVADPMFEKVQKAKEEFGIKSENCFYSVEEMLQKPKLADLIVIATQDRQHVQQAVPALQKGYHVICEKPISTNLEECLLLKETAARSGRIVAVGHVLRYTPFFTKIKQLISEGEIGKIVTLQAIENVTYWHQAHSYVRGNWRNSNTSSPMILAKSCHDMDIFSWLLDQNCRRISSYGSVFLFKQENAPKGSTPRCTQGCTAKENCPYDAEKIYITNEETGVRNLVHKHLVGDDAWPCNVLVPNPTEESIREAIETGPYGKCVYHCDNNVVDQQIVNMEFENGATVSFTMTAFTSQKGRHLKIMGTMGDIIADLNTNEIVLTKFGKPPQVFDVRTMATDFSGHSGGDNKLIHDVLKAVELEKESEESKQIKGVSVINLKTGIEASLQSHIMAFAAEYSRIHRGESVDLEQFMQQKRYLQV